jgi:hypothetical protein
MEFFIKKTPHGRTPEWTYFLRRFGGTLFVGFYRKAASIILLAVERHQWTASLFSL